MHFLTPAEVARLADIVDDRYRALIYTAAYTGMRWGELAGLRTHRLDFDAATVRVVEAQTEVNGYVEMGPTKTGAHRTISLPPFLVAMLRTHVDAYASTDGAAFTSSEGTAVRRNFYDRHFKKAVRRAGLAPKLRFHDLRHTCATLLLSRNVNPKIVSEMLGHASVSITLDIYSHLLPDMQEKAARALEDALS